MNEANRSLQDFVAFLGSPDMYGSMSLAAQMLKWAVHAVVTVLMLAAVIGVLFVVLKFAADVVFLSGAGHLIKGNAKADKFINKVEGFASNGAVAGDIKRYIKEDLWKPIVTLAFIGILASGMALPLAGQVAGIIGAGVDKLIGLDPATQIENFDVAKFKESIKYSRANDLKVQYDKNLAQVQTYRDTIYDIGTKNPGEDNATLQKYKTLYTGALAKTVLISNNLKTNGSISKELKLSPDYFEQHKKNGLCQSNFIDKKVSQSMGVSVVCSGN